jgi:hypothetical protein
MSWFEKLLPSRIRIDGKSKRTVPEGVWSKCPLCQVVLYSPELERHLNVCPKCKHHLRIGARQRLESFLDPEPREEIGTELSPADRLKFRDRKKYKDRLAQTQKATGEKDALLVFKGQVHGVALVAAAFEFKFMGGSMGSVVGERFVRGVNVAIEHSIPFVCFSASGGARMQEALFSLMQMSKTSAALNRLFLLLKFKTEDQVVDERLEKWKADNPESDEEMAEKFEKKARKQVQKARKNLPTEISDKQVFLKLFKDLPRSDLEMLFPNQEVRLKLFDKIKLAVTGGGGTIFGIFTTAGKVVAAATNPILLIGAFVGLIGIIIRQIMNIFNQRTKYMMTLSRNLYFHNLDNNVGVMNYLIDMAEEEEGKEAILAYYFLHTQPDKDYTKEALDREIEGYLRNKYGTDIDFEVDDGIRKLREEGILTEQEGGILKVLDLKGASAILDKQWDNFFNPD